MNRTLHVVGLPHTTLTEKNATCAYSMKVAKFVPMMRAQGCRVVLYGPDEIDCEPDEHVVITTEFDRDRWGFGNGFDTAKTPFLWDSNQPYWFESSTRAIDAMRERICPRDYVCLITSTQSLIADTICGSQWNKPMAVEWGVGYEGIDGRGWCAFESYAWMHHVYGLKAAWRHKGDWRAGRVFDSVIPNFFDPSQFPETTNPTGDYLLFMGRLIARKGPHIAAEIAKRVGLPLKLAGPGAETVEPGKITADGVEITGDVEYLGEVGFAERAELMGNAAAVIVPTVYLEPFGGVAVEAMMAGAPVVASDWGSFTELIPSTVGRRFRTLRQGARAVEEALELDRSVIREHARAHYSLEAVGPMFMRWFDQLDTLWGEGFYA